VSGVTVCEHVFVQARFVKQNLQNDFEIRVLAPHSNVQNATTIDQQ
jgi:hypothetical protein